MRTSYATRVLNFARPSVAALTLMWTSCALLGCPGRQRRADAGASTTCSITPTAFDTLTFHRDRARHGWNSSEASLAPAAVADARFGLVWNSAPFDSITIGGVSYAPHVYASPLYVDRACVIGGELDGASVGLAFAATSNGFAYAITTRAVVRAGVTIPAGAIAWRRALGHADVVPTLDGGMPMGALSTPVIDLTTAPPTLYVTSMDATLGWQVFALDLRDGSVLAGWPVRIDPTAVEAVNRNGPAAFDGDARVLSQRGALALSPDGTVLYVPFGAYFDGGVGWLVGVDTRAGRVVASFSGAPSSAHEANGGIWGPGGVSVDDDGTVCATTGNSPVDSHDSPRVWGQSLLCFDSSLHLLGTFTPFNYCDMDASDTDLGGSSPLLLPALDPGVSLARRLMVFGGKQGTVYLLDRDALPGSLAGRPPCSTNSGSDRSLVPPGRQPQFMARGPLNVFGPYSEQFGNLDRAKMRSTPAYFRDATGRDLLFVTGSTKATVDSMASVPPSFARLVVVTSPSTSPYLAIDAYESTLAFLNPGSPVVSSDGPRDPVVWVLDENARRVDSLLDPGTPHPILYAVDGTTSSVLWTSERNARDRLNMGGKYSTVAIARGVALVGTDRLQAFGAGAR